MKTHSKILKASKDYASVIEDKLASRFAREDFREGAKVMLNLVLQELRSEEGKFLQTVANNYTTFIVANWLEKRLK